MAIRGSTLASKFLLIFVLAFYLEPEDVGLYGLFVAAITYGIYPLGLEFYTYSIREFIKSDRKKWTRYLMSQVGLYCILYIIFLPLFLLLFFYKILPWYFALYFYLLLIFEHLNQELMRLLIAMSKQLSASLALFFRQGIWALFLILVMYFYPESRDIEYVFIFWLAGSLAALLLSLFYFYQMKLEKWCFQFDWLWIKKGIMVSLPFFISTLCLSAISTFDKYLFDYIVDREILGAYVFYMGLSAALISLLDAAVYSFIYPKMISSYSNGNSLEYNLYIKKMLFQMLLLSSIFMLSSFLIIEYVVGFIGKSVYSDNINIFYIVLLAMFVQALSYVPHYALYAQGNDRSIIQSHAASVFLFLAFVYFMEKLSAVYAIPFSLLMTFLSILCWKTIVFIKNREI